MISISHLHPMLVHFPIALLIFGFIANVASFFYQKERWLSSVSFYLLLAGMLTALIALLSGTLFTSDMSGSAGEIKDTHELFAWITLGMTIITAAFRIFLKIKNLETSKLKWAALAMYAIVAISVSITGFYGGTLVYNYMMPL